MEISHINLMSEWPSLSAQRMLRVEYRFDNAVRLRQLKRHILECLECDQKPGVMSFAAQIAPERNFFVSKMGEIYMTPDLMKVIEDSDVGVLDQLGIAYRYGWDSSDVIELYRSRMVNARGCARISEVIRTHGVVSLNPILIAMRGGMEVDDAVELVDACQLNGHELKELQPNPLVKQRLARRF